MSVPSDDNGLISFLSGACLISCTSALYIALRISTFITIPFACVLQNGLEQFTEQSLFEQSQALTSQKNHSIILQQYIFY